MFNVNILWSKESYKILCMLWLQDNKYNWKFLYPNINSDVGIVTSLSSFIPFVPPFLNLSSLLSFIFLSFLFSTMPIYKASCGSVGKESACNVGDPGSIPWSGRSSGEGNGNPLQLPGEFHGQRSLVGCSPWGHKDLVVIEWLTQTYIRTEKSWGLKKKIAVILMICCKLTESGAVLQMLTWILTTMINIKEGICNAKREVDIHV